MNICPSRYEKHLSDLIAQTEVMPYADSADFYLRFLQSIGVDVGGFRYRNGGQYFAAPVLQYQMAETRVRVAGVNVLYGGAYSCVNVLQPVAKDIFDGH